MSQRARAWLALVGPALVWLIFQQGLGWVLRVACDRAPIGLAWGAASLLVCAVVIWPARRLARAGGEAVHPWLARIALLGGTVFALAITFQTLAVALVSPCAR